MSDGHREVWLGMDMREGRTGAQSIKGSSGHWGSSPGEMSGCLPSLGVLQFGVRPAPSPVVGVPGFGAYEVLMVAALEISGLCETVVSEVSPSSPPHTLAPSVHRIHRQLAPPEQ